MTFGSICNIQISILKYEMHPFEVRTFLSHMHPMFQKPKVRFQNYQKFQSRKSKFKTQVEKF
jgi:hypothetical protein